MRREEQSKSANSPINNLSWKVIRSIKARKDNKNEKKIIIVITTSKILVTFFALGEMLIIVKPQYGKKIKKNEKPSSANIPFS